MSEKRDVPDRPGWWTNGKEKGKARKIINTASGLGYYVSGLLVRVQEMRNEGPWVPLELPEVQSDEDELAERLMAFAPERFSKQRMHDILSDYDIKRKDRS